MPSVQIRRARPLPNDGEPEMSHIQYGAAKAIANTARAIEESRQVLDGVYDLGLEKPVLDHICAEARLDGV